MKRFCGRFALRSAIMAMSVFPLVATAQINSGSNGEDGEFHPTQDTTVNMTDHPNGIYQYTSVTIPQGVTVTFTPNANNTPVVWLVQSNCTISGTVSVSGRSSNTGTGGSGGPGGWRGGAGGTNPGAGQGPGGGMASDVCLATPVTGSGGSYGTPGEASSPGRVAPTYGNSFLLPLLGGSGGGGALRTCFPSEAGGGGGGAILIAASNTIQVNGAIAAAGGNGFDGNCCLNGSTKSGMGSGGGVRLVAGTVSGNGQIYAGLPAGSNCSGCGSHGGMGRVRFDALDNQFGGSISGVFTAGFQPIIIPAPGQGVQLHIASVAGVAAPQNPGGVLANPDVIVPAQTTNPISIVVECTNVPLNSEVRVTVHPVNGSDVTAVGLNSTGTQASSTATVSLNLPRGGGILYASVVTGINGGVEAAVSAAKKGKTKASYVETGLTAHGERFAKVETKAYLGGKQETTFITKSGKRYPMPGK